MQAIVEFRKSVYEPVLAEYNVSGRGYNHIQEKCALWGQMQEYGYWSIVYNLTSATFDKLITVDGWPTVRMATKKTIEKLAECFPASMVEHLDIKKAIPEREALTLLHSGFVDCSYSNDECATYYLNREWGSDGAPTIAVILDSKSVVYIVCNSFDIEIANFKNVSKAIDFYTTKFMGSK